MSKHAWISFFMAMVVVLLTTTCRPCDDPTNPECPNYCVDETNPACPNYDPCWDQTEVSAAFRLIENGSYGPWELVDTLYPGYDSVSSYLIISDAIHKHPDWTYTWKIGAETYVGDRTALDYTYAPRGEEIEVTLMVEGPPNTDCFPEDDGRDTVSMSFIRTQGSFQDSSEYAGFRNGDPQDSIRIQFFYDYEWSTRRIEGIFEGCRGLFGGAGTYKSFEFADPSIGCNLVRGIMIHDPDKIGDFDQVYCEYSLYPDMTDFPDVERDTFTFEGRRIR